MKFTVAKQIRRNNRHRQYHVADVVGLSQSALSQFENGKLDPDTIKYGAVKLIEAYYGRPVDELVQAVATDMSTASF